LVNLNNLTQNEKEVIFEKNFSNIGITKEERDCYLNLIRNCKDIVDSEHKVDGEGNCEIIQMNFEKKNGEITLNGALSIGSKTKEKRCIDGIILLGNNSILVDMHIVRICVDTLFNEYFVVDEFKLLNGNLIRESYYDYDMKKTSSTINDQEIKGKLK